PAELRPDVFGLSPDGRKIVVADPNAMISVVALDEAKAPAKLAKAFARDDSLTGRLLISSNGLCLCVDLAPNPFDLRTVSIWNLADNKKQCDIDGGKPANFKHLALSPDGAKLAAVRDGKLQIWDSTGGGLLTTLNSKQNFDGPLAFGPTGRILAAYGADFK